MSVFHRGRGNKKEEVISFIVDFASRETGCSHIPSDRYAISVVLPVIALHASGRLELARNLVRSATLWLCDRYQEAAGLASVGAETYAEITTLLGYPFDFIPQRSSRESFLATVLCDLAAFLGDEKFYADIVNDIKACKIFPQYWQAPDTKDQFRIEGTDIITYPNIDYTDKLTGFDIYDFAEHIVHEPRSFRVTQIADSLGLMLIMLLLRDRYFPTLWPLLKK